MSVRGVHKESKRLLLFDPRGDELRQFAPDAGSPGSPYPDQLPARLLLSEQPRIQPHLKNVNSLPKFRKS